MEYGKKVQIHNFVMLKYKACKASFIKVSSVSGDWSVSYREDNMMFLTLDLAEGKSHEALYNVLMAIYGTCNIVDRKYTQDVFDAMSGYFERVREKQDVPSQEEDAKILEEERKIHDIKEEMDSL